jgi:hypothetical protein
MPCLRKNNELRTGYALSNNLRLLRWTDPVLCADDDECLCADFIEGGPVIEVFFA